MEESMVKYSNMLAFLLIFTSTITAQRIKLNAGDVCGPCQAEDCSCQVWSKCDILQNLPEANITFCNRVKGIVCCPQEPPPPENCQLTSPAEVGDVCGPCQAEDCSCQVWSKCDVLQNLPVANITFCNREKGIVCCPEEPLEREICLPTSPAEVACHEFTKHAPAECPEHFIAGGELAKIGEFPSAALIGIFNSTSNVTDWICGGTLISERFVLTAAHCTLNGVPNKVRLGDLDYNSTLDDVGLQEFSVLSVKLHDNFTLDRYFDIMLLELNGTVTFSKYVLPACLLTPYMMKFQTGHYWAVGWGRIDDTEVFSTQLRRVELKHQTVCNETATLIYDLERGLLEPIQFCTDGKTYHTCNGYSGGPLLIPFPHSQVEYRCMYMVAGIVSKGQEHCGVEDLPIVNTNVTAFVRFIESFVWPQKINTTIN
ncbi:CLIP domain-containing serine protease B4-like isoform X1 [Anastrepha obliqua]|uniref:CLIP domain-containing serine protease B4-like isoform X1 n=1 Tax=Anastrepha obliqua TaxID=95512 RepID=UPI00240A73EE|nr:CLIP domain-containing serine protease B4-like isoform X1 [Anastrepha obliqua]